MKIDIYHSTINGAKYFSVPAGTDVAALQLPSDVDSDILKLSPFKTRLEIDFAKPRATFDQKEVMYQIQKQGFAIHGALLEIALTKAE